MNPASDNLSQLLLNTGVDPGVFLTVFPHFLSLFFDHLERFNLIVFLNIIEIGHDDTAFIAGLDFLNIILKALERSEISFKDLFSGS